MSVLGSIRKGLGFLMMSMGVSSPAAKRPRPVRKTAATARPEAAGEVRPEAAPQGRPEE
jgi:hypothetical protein